MKNWTDTLISTLLRTGVILSVIIIFTGLSITFVHHPEYFSSRPKLGALTSPGVHFPSTFMEVVQGVRNVRGQAIMAAGLLLLIATPVARVALSVVIFLVERDRLYAVITTAVFAILMVAFALGRVA